MLKLRFLVVLLALGAMSSWANDSLTPHSATYNVKISVLNGKLKTQLLETPGGYEATHIIEPTGMSRMFARGTITETSRFERTDSGIQPLEYMSDDQISRDKENVQVAFDWNSGEARGTVNGQDVVSAIEGIAHDRVSIQYEVMQDLLDGQLGDNYTMFEIDRLRPVNITNVGEKSVKVPAGTYNVIGIRHQSQGSKRTTTLWCAPALDYLPVIIEQHRKGKLKVRASLTDYLPVTTR